MTSESDMITEIEEMGYQVWRNHSEIKSIIHYTNQMEAYRYKYAIEMLARFEMQVSYCMDKDIDNVQEVVKTLDQFKKEVAKLRREREEERWNSLQRMMENGMSEIQMTIDNGFEKILAETNELLYEGQRIFRDPYSPSPPDE